MTARSAIAPAVLAILAATAGCLSGLPAAEPGSATPDGPGAGEDPYATVDASPPDLGEPVDCGDRVWVGLWGLSDPSYWGPDVVRYGAYHPANTSLLYVAYVDGEPAGAALLDRDDPVHVDGGTIELAEPLAGEHRLRLVVHRDADADGEFDPAVDRPCVADDGGPVRTGAVTVDFSRLATETTDG